MLQASGITGGYDQEPVLRDLDLSVRSGEFVGLIGPNGCGKSTLLRALSGVLAVDSGSIVLRGRPLAQMSSRDIALALAFVPQSERSAFDYSVQDVVLMGRYPHRRRGQGLSGDDFAHVRRALAAADILYLAERPITRLSGGEHRRVLLARALAQDAPLMLLDEPTAHLDITHQVEMLGIVRKLTRRVDAPIGALAALHDLNQAAEVCDRLALMRAGRIIIDGPPDEVLTAAYLKQVYNADAQVGRNPVTGRPTILSLVPARDALPTPNTRRVHVICGGGSGIGILNILVRNGFVVTSGVLNRLDTDQEAAEALGIEVAVEAPYSAFGPSACAYARSLMEKADVIIVAPVPFGHGNLANLQMAANVQNGKRSVLVLGSEPFKRRDYVGGAAVELLQQITRQGGQQFDRLEDWSDLAADVPIEPRVPNR